MSGSRLLFERILGLDEYWNHSEYASVNKWITTLRRRGDRQSTRLAYLKWLSTFLRYLNLTTNEDSELSGRLTSRERRESLVAKVRAGLTPDGLVLLPSSEVSEKAQAFCDRYNEAGKARTAHLAMTYLRSFWKHNGLGKLEVEDYNWRKNKGFEYVPSKEDVYRMADQTDARGRAIILCAFQSGLRNSALRSLCYGDVREQLQAAKMPVAVHVCLKMRQRVPQACKEDAEFYTFLGKESSQALKEYVDWRAKKFGKIEDDAPLFLPYESFSLGVRKENHISEDSLQRMVKRAARRARIKDWQYVRFHGLRKTFRSVLDAGYVDGGQMAEDDKEYLMGHRLPNAKEPYHNANVETLAQRYMKLDWAYFPKQAASVEELRKKQVLDMIKILGFSDDKIKRVEETLAKHQSTDEALDEIKKLNLNSQREASRERRPTAMHSRKEIRIVHGDDKLVKFLNSGWDIIKELSVDKFIMQRNSESELA